MPNDTESPDHAGLRSGARATPDSVLVELIAGANDLHELMGENMSAHTKIDRIADFGREYYVKGVASQDAELATLRAELSSANAFGDKCTESIEEMGIEATTLRADRARLNDEVNALAGQVQSLKTENDKLINIVALTIKATCTCSLAGEPIEYHSHNCRAKVIYRGIADIPEATLEGEPVEAK